MATITFTDPVVSGSENTWGTTINSNFTVAENAFNGVTQIEPALVEGGWEIGATTVTSTGAELNLLDGVTWTLTDFNALTATVTELNYSDGVTSNIQTQLDAKQPLDATLTALAALSTGVSKVPYSTGTDTFGQLDFVDEDDMASDSATALPSQQSVKAYVDDAVDGNTIDQSGAGSAGYYGARAWVSFNNSGTILAQQNVSSVSRTANGVFEITFTTAMPDTNYAVVTNMLRGDSLTSLRFHGGYPTSTTYCRALIANDSRSGESPSIDVGHVVIYR